MKKTINFLVTLTVLIFATQFYVLKSETTLAQVDPDADVGADGNSSEEFFDQGDAEMERESQYLESENSQQNVEDELDLKQQKVNEELNREEVSREEGLNREDQNEDERLEREAESFKNLNSN